MLRWWLIGFCLAFCVPSMAERRVPRAGESILGLPIFSTDEGGVRLVTGSSRPDWLPDRYAASFASGFFSHAEFNELLDEFDVAPPSPPEPIIAEGFPPPGPTSPDRTPPVTDRTTPDIQRPEADASQPQLPPPGEDRRRTVDEDRTRPRPVPIGEPSRVAQRSLDPRTADLPASKGDGQRPASGPTPTFSAVTPTAKSNTLEVPAVSSGDGHGGGDGPVDLTSVMQKALDNFAEGEKPLHPEDADRPFDAWVTKKNSETDAASDRARQMIDNPDAFSREDIARSLMALIALEPPGDGESDRDISGAREIVVSVLGPQAIVVRPSGEGIARSVGLPLSGGNYFDQYGNPTAESGVDQADRRPSSYGPSSVLVMKGALGPDKGKNPGLVPTKGALPTLVTNTKSGPAGGSASSDLIRGLADTLKSQRRMSHGWLARVGVNPEKTRRAVSNARRSVASVSPVLSGVLFPGDPGDPSMIPAVLLAILSGGFCAFLAFRRREQKNSPRVPAGR